MSKTDKNAQDQKPKKSKLAIAIAIAGFLIILVWLLLPTIPIIQGPLARQIICVGNLRVLGMAIMTYSELNDGKYPTPDKWCDLLIEHVELTEKSFVCPAAKEGRGHYAINPNCEPNSPPDMVLLFETKGGWNQFGGPELLAGERHKGCCILFNDNHVQFVEKERLSQLKWKVEESKK